jgi:glycosyltransferase involved in cell wall biosynthesis
MPKVSVIMPTYNRAAFLPISVRSVLEQTYTDLELIIVDDGSTDGTEKVVKSIDDPRIKYYYQKNAGVSAARNLALEHAEGEWITFLDSDDIYTRDRLLTFLDYAKDRADGLFYSAMIRFSFKDGRMLLTFDYGIEKEFDLNTYQHRNIFVTSAVMLKKSILDQAGRFDVLLNFSEDWDLFLRVSDHFPVYQIKVPTFYYQVWSISDPLKQHHLPDNRQKNLNYIAEKRINELLPVYERNKDPQIALKIFLISRHLGDDLRKKELVGKLDSVNHLVAALGKLKDNINDGSTMLAENKGDGLINYLVKNTQFTFDLPENTLNDGSIGNFEKALLAYFR